VLKCWFHFIIQISVCFRWTKFGSEFGYRRRLGGLPAIKHTYGTQLHHHAKFYTDRLHDQWTTTDL